MPPRARCPQRKLKVVLALLSSHIFPTLSVPTTRSRGRASQRVKSVLTEAGEEEEKDADAVGVAA